MLWNRIVVKIVVHIETEGDVGMSDMVKMGILLGIQQSWGSIIQTRLASSLRFFVFGLILLLGNWNETVFFCSCHGLV